MLEEFRQRNSCRSSVSADCDALDSGRRRRRFGKDTERHFRELPRNSSHVKDAQKASLHVGGRSEDDLFAHIHRMTTFATSRATRPNQ